MYVDGARARESRDFHVRGTDDVWLTLPADSVYENGVVEVSLLHVWWWNFDLDWVESPRSR